MKTSACSVLLLFLATGCATQNRWVTMAAHDVRELATAPAKADREQWKRAALVTAAVTATFAIDDSMRDMAHANTSGVNDNIAEVVTPFGGRYSDRVLAGFLAAGLVARNEKAKAVAFDGFVTSVFASKVFTPTLKRIAQRERPDRSDDDSFPSNHATQAFGIASVIAAHYDSRWVDAAAYSLAALVGAARIYDDVHWTSDVVAGAVIGTATGRFVVAANKRRRATWTVVPIYHGRRRGAFVSFTFATRPSSSRNH
jgi:membrane-associated phospholipid phosphatase